jgi:hypothetical protein
MVWETEMKKFRQEVREEFNSIKKLICGKNIVGNWITQEMAGIMIGVKPRQLRNLRIHLKGNKLMGCIKWRKGKGKSVQYWKPDLEKYLNEITVG